MTYEVPIAPGESAEIETTAETDRRRMADVGGVRPGPARGIPCPHRQPPCSRRREPPSRTPGTSTPGRGEGVSVWVVPSSRDSLLRARRRGRLRRCQREDVPDGDRPTRSPTKWGRCDAVQYQVPSTKSATRSPCSSAMPTTTWSLPSVSGDWISRGPELEEDIALGNIALDHLGVARALYTLAGAVEGLGRDEDDLAMFRSEREYLNLLLVEQPNGDFAHTMVRQFLFDGYQLQLWEDLSGSRRRSSWRGSPAAPSRRPDITSGTHRVG